MLIASRADETWFGRWWFGVDRWLLFSLLTLIVIGIFLVMAASPAVAIRIGAPPLHFVYNHLAIEAIGLVLMIGISTLSPRQVRMLALAVTFVTICLLIMVPFVGEEIKGARRWIHLPGFSLQPSEFIKPSLAIVEAWLFSKSLETPAGAKPFKGRAMGLGLYFFSLALLLLQPDLGMSILLTVIIGVQFLMTGVSYRFFVVLVVLAICGGVAAYFVFPHVTARVNKFMSDSEESYQIDKSLEAFRHGGLLGTGPGQGEVKYHIPDAHADFVFSVAGEEMGLMFTLSIIALFIVFLSRGFWQALNARDLFTTMALTGLLVQFGLQAMIHMASTLSIIPTKGMTLPFLSYGGSSSLALSYGMGMLLALTRRGAAKDLR
jgi:cell division protein FtsW